MTRDEELLNEIIQRRGYLVMCSIGPYRVGEWVKGLRYGGHETESHFYVLEATDVDDMREQWNLQFGTEVPQEFLTAPYFYRVLSD